MVSPFPIPPHTLPLPPPATLTKRRQSSGGASYEYENVKDGDEIRPSTLLREKEVGARLCAHTDTQTRQTASAPFICGKDRKGGG